VVRLGRLEFIIMGFADGWSGDWRIYGSESNDEKVRRETNVRGRSPRRVLGRGGTPICLACVSPGAADSSKKQGIPMVVIRLARGGAKKRPFFNIVVADSRTRRDGRFLERVGFYNPVASGGEEPLRVAFDRVAHWASNGAQLSPTVERLVAQAKAKVAA
jgi:small subunit ribosomal protein S16